ncbi:MAG TPA: hypothetical protein VGJ84_06130 [Polyangiaceae bacterium]|jgi:hypothetical protein
MFAAVRGAASALQDGVTRRLSMRRNTVTQDRWLMRGGGLLVFALVGWAVLPLMVLTLLLLFPVLPLMGLLFALGPFGINFGPEGGAGQSKAVGAPRREHRRYIHQTGLSYFRT